MDKGVRIKIGSVVCDYDGNPLVSDGKQMTARLLLRMYAGSYIPEPGPDAGGESVIAHSVGLIMHKSGDVAELTNEEHEILKKAIAQPRHPAVIYTYIYKAVYDVLETIPAGDKSGEK